MLRSQSKRGCEIHGDASCPDDCRFGGAGLTHGGLCFNRENYGYVYSSLY